MLKNKLFIINKIEKSVQDGDNVLPQPYKVDISLDPAHDIFKGHFPGNPILPGVCQVEIVRELAEIILEKKLMLTQASQIKYMNLINPLSDPLLQVHFKITGNGAQEFDVSVELGSAEKVFMKMKGRMKEHQI